MKKIIAVLFTVFLTAFGSAAQDTCGYQRLRMGVETGFERFFGSNLKPPALRESQHYYDNYGNYNDYGNLRDLRYFTRYYVGVKSEYSLNHFLSIAGGLRFSCCWSEFASDRNNFLWRVENAETVSNYVRVSRINQNVYSVGIPLELKIYFKQKDALIRWYYKAGLVFNLAFAPDVSVEFADKAMNKYEREVKRGFNKPDLFSAQVVLIGFGLKIGKNANPFGTIEYQIPLQFSDKTRLGSLFKMRDPVGVGLQATIYFPAGKKRLNYHPRQIKIHRR